MQGCQEYCGYEMLSPVEAKKGEQFEGSTEIYHVSMQGRQECCSSAVLLETLLRVQFEIDHDHHS